MTIAAHKVLGPACQCRARQGRAGRGAASCGASWWGSASHTIGGKPPVAVRPAMLRQCVAWRGRAGTGDAWSGEPWQTHCSFNESAEVWFLARCGAAGPGGARLGEAERCDVWRGKHTALSTRASKFGRSCKGAARSGWAGRCSARPGKAWLGNHTHARKGAGKFWKENNHRKTNT
jgi:hypothetical protein